MAAAPVATRMLVRTCADPRKECALRATLDAAMRASDPDAVAAALLALHHHLCDTARELVALEELEFGLGWLWSHDGIATAAQRWPVMLALAMLCERLGAPRRATTLATAALAEARRAGDGEGARDVARFAALLAPAGHLLATRRDVA